MKKRGIIVTAVLLMLAMGLSAGVVFAATKSSETNRQSFLDEKFAGYVTNGIITQEQADTILADLKTMPMGRNQRMGNGFGMPMFMTDEERAEFKTMTNEEKQAYMQEQKAKFNAMTDEEKAALREQMQANRPGKGLMIRLTDEQKTALAALATSEEKIAYVTGLLSDEQKAQFEVMTEEQKIACIERMTSIRPMQGQMQKRGGGRGQGYMRQKATN